MILHPILSIAKKEIMDNIRNKWLLLLTVIFTALTLLASYLGSLFSQGWQDFGGTIGAMSSFIQFFVPIIGLLLGYSAIIGEIERGSMSALLSLPTTRLEIILGKYLGLGGVIFITMTVGFGIAGIVIAINVPGANGLEYLAFMFATCLICLVFLSASFFFSTVFKKRSTAIGGAIFLWLFFNIILPMVLTGLLFLGVSFSDIYDGSLVIPEWYYAVQLINPWSVYSNYIQMTIQPLSAGIDAILPQEFPSYYSPALMIALLLVWICSFFLLAYWLFRRKDI